MSGAEGYRLERDSLGEVRVPARRVVRRADRSGRWRTSRSAVCARGGPSSGRWRRSSAPRPRSTRPGAARRRRRPRPSPAPPKRSSDGQVGRPVRRRSVPGRRRHQPQHERQRGDRQPRHPDPGRAAGRVPRPPQRPRQHGPVHQRHHPHRHPPGLPVAAGRTARGGGRSWRRRSSAKAAEFDAIVKSGRTHLQDAVPVRLGQEFGALCQGGGARRRAHPPVGRRAAPAGHRRHGRRHRASTPIPSTMPAWSRRLSELTGLELQTCDNLFESDAVAWPTRPTSRPRCARWRSP